MKYLHATNKLRVLFSIILFLQVISKLYAQTPFACQDGISYLLEGANSHLYTVDLRTGTRVLLFDAATLGNHDLTGLGYNPVDNFLYASVSGTNDIARIDAAGLVTIFDVAGLPATTYQAGDVSADGTLFLYESGANLMYKVNLATLAVSTLTLQGGVPLNDFSISPAGDFLYGIITTGGNLVSFSTINGVRAAPRVGLAAFSSAAFMDKFGNLFLVNDANSDVYEVPGAAQPLANASVVRAFGSSAKALIDTDGARCVNSAATTGPAPFSCEANAAYILNSNTRFSAQGCILVTSTVTLTEFDLATGATVSTTGRLIPGSVATDLNNMGYNPKDNYLWAHRLQTNQLARIGPGGSIDYFAIPGLPDVCNSGSQINNANMHAGDISPDGIMYLMNGVAGDRLLRVDLNPSSPTYLTKLPDILLNPFNLTPPGGDERIVDLAFNPVDGFLYNLNNNNELIRINATTGLITNLGATSGIPAPENAQGYVACFFDNAGSLYVRRGLDQSYYRITNVAAGNKAATLFSTVGGGAAGDGARCALSPVTAPVPLSGTVFNDANGLNSTPVNTIDGTPLQFASDVQIYANLFTNNTLVASVAVDVAGNFLFPNVGPSTEYVITVSTTQAPLGSNPGSSTGLPVNWIYTGETGNGLGTLSDGLVNGTNTVSVGTEGVSNINFGIEQLPDSDDKTNTITAPPVNSYLTLDGTVANVPFLTGSDPEDQPASEALSGKTAAITSLPTNGQLFYEGVQIRFGADNLTAPSPSNPFLITTLDNSLLQIRFTGTGYETTSFTYAYVDGAGGQDPSPATYTLSWNPLPVTLISFNAKQENKLVVLTWETTEETNSDRFEIEWKTSGEWKKIGAVTAAKESNGLKRYTFQHNEPAAGQNLYRLKMIDSDGTFTLSAIRNVDFKGFETNAVYPNPVSNGKLSLTDWTNVKSVEIYNQKGQKLKTFNILNKGDMDVSSLPSGLYVIKRVLLNGSSISRTVAVNN